MSETSLKFFLDELETIRVLCQNPRCGAVVEMTIASLPDKLKNPKCPFCGFDYDLQYGNDSSLAKLAIAIGALKLATERCRVEFVLPQPSADKQAPSS